MNKNLEFLLAPRFWSMVLASAGVVLLDPNFGTQAWYTSLGKFLALVGAGFTTVATFDRAVDKQVDVANINANNK